MTARVGASGLWELARVHPARVGLEGEGSHFRQSHNPLAGFAPLLRACRFEELGPGADCVVVWNEALSFFAYEDRDDVVELVDTAAALVSQGQALYSEGEPYATRFSGRPFSFAASSSSRALLADEVLTIDGRLL